MNINICIFIYTALLLNKFLNVKKNHLFNGKKGAGWMERYLGLVKWMCFLQLVLF